MLRFSGKIKIFILLTTLSFLLSLPTVVLSAEEAAQTTVVESMGTGVIVNNNSPAARNRAISASLIAAIEKAVSEILPANSLVSNFNTVNKIIYGFNESFVLNYKVLAETKHKNMYRVMIRAKVSVSNIRQQLSQNGIIYDQKSMPKVLFFITENSPDKEFPLYWWGENMANVMTETEDSISTTLQKKGFVVVSHIEPGQITNSDSESESETAPLSFEISKESALLLAQKFQADVFVMGKAESSLTKNTMGEEKSFSGKIEIKAYRTDTGVEIASSMQTKIAVGTDDLAGQTEALQGAAVLAGEDLAPKLIAAWEKEEKKPTAVELIVEGKNYLGNFISLRRVLNEMPGVNKVQTRGMQSDEATVIVNYQGSGKDLANELLQKTFPRFGINITEVSETSLRVELTTESRTN